jgi:hypothetical protein
MLQASQSHNYLSLYRRVKEIALKLEISRHSHQSSYLHRRVSKIAQSQLKRQQVFRDLSPMVQSPVRSANLSIESVKLKPKLLSPLSLSLRSCTKQTPSKPSTTRRVLKLQPNKRKVMKDVSASTEDFEVRLSAVLMSQHKETLQSTLEVNQLTGARYSPAAQKPFPVRSSQDSDPSKVSFVSSTATLPPLKRTIILMKKSADQSPFSPS